MRKNKISIDDEQEIIRIYSVGKTSMQALADKFGTSRQPIDNILKKYNIAKRPLYYSSRKYFLNQNYFNLIDTSDKAYFLGWMFADGCNYTKQRYFRLELSAKDKEVLINFKKYLESDHIIKYTKDKIRGYEKCHLTIRSEKLSLDLESQGCIPAKSLILNWPKAVSDNLIKFFIRGYFEGDGCLNSVYRKKRKEWTLRIACSEIFSEKLNEYIYNTLGFKFNQYRSGKIKILQTAKKDNIMCFLCWLYSDLEDLFLSRKLEKFKDLLSSV